MLLEEFARLLDGVLVVIVLPIREVMLGLILPFVLLRLLELGTDVLELIGLVEVFLLELGADVRELIDRLDMALLGARLVMTLLEVLLLGARFVIALLEVLTLGALLVMTLLEVLLLGALLVIALLEVLLLGAGLVMVLLEVLLLDEALLVRLDDDLLDDEDLAAEDALEDCRFDLLELFDLLLERDLAAITGSQNNKSANRVQKTRKSEPSRSDPTALSLEFWVLSFFEYIIRLLSSALTTLFLFHPLKAKSRSAVTKISLKMSFFHFFLLNFTYTNKKGLTVLSSCQPFDYIGRFVSF